MAKQVKAHIEIVLEIVIAICDTPVIYIASKIKKVNEN